MKLNVASRAALVLALAVGAGYFLLSCEAKKVDPTGPPQLGSETTAPTAAVNGDFQQCVLGCLEIYKQEVQEAWQKYHDCMQALSDDVQQAWQEFEQCMSNARSPAQRRRCSMELRRKMMDIRQKQRQCYKQLQADLKQAKENLDACIAGCQHDQGGGGN